MLNLSRCFDDFHIDAVTFFEKELQSWPVFHAIVPGKTEPKNFEGVGPWARIWALKQPSSFVLSSSHEIISSNISYLIAVFIPRVYTTDDILETLLHEYLHIGTVRGTVNYHPPGQEDEFISKSKRLAKTMRQHATHSKPMAAIDKGWEEFSNIELTGYSVVGLDEKREYTFPRTIKVQEITLGSELC